MGKSISVVLPAYNEEASITQAVLEIDNYLKSRFKDYEILVVSEGSTDKTVEVAGKLKPKVKNLRILGKKEWTGFGGAIRTGFKSAVKDLIFYTDADRQFDIKELDKLLPLIDKYDIVTGYKLERNDAPVRLWMSRLYNLTMRWLFGLKVRDMNCAFKLYKKEVIQKINFLPNVTEGIINAEIYIDALKNGYTIGEVGVHHFPRQAGSAISEIGLFKGITLINPRVVLRFLKDTLRIFKKVYL